MPEQIFLQDKDVVLEFPDGTPDHIIQETIKREYPMTGEEVAGHMMVNPDWFNNDMTLDEYKRYREWKNEQSMGVGDFASAAGGAFKQVGGEVVGALGEMVTSPIQSAKAFPSAVGVGTLDIWNLGKQIVNHFKETDDTYEDFLAGRKDTEARRTEYDKQLEKDMAAERDKIQYFNQIREDLIKESDNPEFTRGASNVLDPTIFFGGFLGKQFAKAASKVAATATGKAASKIGRGMYQFGDKLGEIGEGAQELGSRAFTGVTGVTPETGRALAIGTGIGGGVMTAGAPVVAGAYGATKGLQVGGRVLAEAGEGLQRGIGREGFFGGAAARLEPGSGAQRLAQGLSLTDPLLEYGARAAGGMVAGGVVGMGLGGLADGWEGAASGLGGGMALGGVGGGIARGVEGLSGAALRAKRAKDFDFAASLLPDDQAAMVKGYAKKYGKDQAAMILDTVNYFRGRLGDIDGRTEAEVRFIDKPNSSKRGFVLSVAESNGKPRITVNLGKERSDLTIGHELWHGLLKMEQIQETGIAEAVRTEIRGMWSEGKLIEEGLIPEAQLESYFNDYVNKLTPDEKKSVIDRHGKNTETKSDYIVDEIAAEYMSQLVTGGTKGRGRYDKMLNAFDTFTREKIDDIVIDGSRNVITKAITRLSDMGITPGSSKLFPDLKKASPVVNSLMRKMIRTRKNLDEVVTGLDETFNGKKLTTVIRKKDLKSKQFQDELDSLGLLKDDGKGGKVLKNDKDFAAELEKSEDAVRDILIKGGPDGMRIDTVGEADKQTEIVIGNKFSDEQIQQIKDSATILPHIKQTLADFNSAVDSGSIIDMTYFAATKHITNRLTKKTSPRYSSGISKSRREVLPYKIAFTNAGNFLVKAINWTQLWTKTATQAASGKLKLWENNHKAFLDDFKLYLDNYVSDKPETSASVFGKAKADYMHSLMEGGGRDSIVKDFRLDRVHGMKETGEKAAMSEIAWRRSQARFMPDEGTPVRQGETPAKVPTFRQGVIRVHDGLEDSRYMPSDGNPVTQNVARAYANRYGINYRPHAGYIKPDDFHLKELADWMQEAPHRPDDPEVQASYKALRDEVLAQYDAMLEAGVRPEPWEGQGEPYANSKEMMADVRDNGHLWFFRTENGFGETGMPPNHPMLEMLPMEINGKQLMLNDLFRIVHDYFGHTQQGFQFGARGEYNAFKEHSAMFTEEAQGALAAETLAQNAWVNFGKHLRREDGSLPKPKDSDWVHPADRPFADQKANVVPEDIRFMPDVGKHIKGVGDPAENLRQAIARKPLTGVAKNPLTRFHDDNGRSIVIGSDKDYGGKNFDSWIEETRQWLTPEEISDFRDWYSELRGVFEKEFGKRDADKMMMAWLGSQQNASPLTGMQNVFRVEDRLGGIDSGKKGGLADEKIEAILKRKVPKKGFGAKLSDFVDSGYLKKTRTYMGGDPRGGQPFVADVHTGRDSGHVDHTTLTRLMERANSGKLFIDGQPVRMVATKTKKVTTKDAKGKTKTSIVPEQLEVTKANGEKFTLDRDMIGSPSSTLYEGISVWGNNLTDHLNRSGYEGGKWTPAEVQAVGWMRILRQYSLPESTVAETLLANTHRVSAEVNYDWGNILPAIFPEFTRLPDKVQMKITKDVMTRTVQDLVRIIGGSLRVRNLKVGTGYWEGTKAPSIQAFIMGSPEAGAIFRDALALVTEQTQSFMVTFGKGGKAKQAVSFGHIDGKPLSSVEADSFIDFIGQQSKGVQNLIKGFSAFATPDGKGMLIAGLTEKSSLKVRDLIETWGDQNNIDIRAKRFSALTEGKKNEWKEKTKGEVYLSGIVERGGSSRVRAINDYRGRYFDLVEQAFKKHAPEALAQKSSPEQLAQGRQDFLIEPSRGNDPGSTRFMPDAAMDALPSGEGAVEKRVPIPRRGIGGNVPEISEIRAALSDDRKPKVGVGDKLKTGDPVGLRIDIPAFERTLTNPVSKTGEPTYAISVHGKWKGGKGGSAGTIVGYENLVRVKNPVFMVNEKAAARIRGGKAKSTIATVEGAYVKSKAIPSDISNWTQVGMNPKRHSYFYDRATGEPVVGGTEALSVGGTVFVKDAKFGSRGDFRFMPDVGGQDALGMFSAAERATVDLKQEKGGASQMLAMIKKAGVKDEEIAELGLDKFLEGNRKVSKDEIIDYLVENQVTVEETVLGEPHPYKAKLDSLRLRDEELNRLQFDRTSPESVDPHSQQFRDIVAERESIQQEVIRIAEVAPEPPNPTQHSEYVEPGAVEGSYRELLLRLPDRSGESLTSVDAVFTDFINQAEPAPMNMYTGDTIKRWIGQKRSEQEMVRDLYDFKNDEVNVQFDVLNKFINWKESQPVEQRPYKGGHYGDYPNTLAHVRFNDRTSEHGKTLFIEEIQSDWHQEGRKKGYGRMDAAERRSLESQVKDGNWQLEEYILQHESDFANHAWLMDRDPVYREMYDKVRAVSSRLSKDRFAIPDAPFKTSWHELSMKRMISYAAKHGYDAIAWTKGETQFQRYGSSEIAWVKDGDGWKVKATEQRGGEADGINIETAARAEGILKEGGDTITSKEQLHALIKETVMDRERGQWSPENFEKQVDKLTSRTWERMQNEDAGTSLPRKEGMGGFYDRMLPKMKTWKKLGLKVESGSFEVGPQGRLKWTVFDPAGRAYDGFETADMAKVAAEDAGPGYTYRMETADLPAHIVKLTPEVKAKVLDTGIARFMPDASVPGAEKNSIGWSMLMSKAGNWRVYGPDGVLAGVAANKNRAEQIFRTKYKRELRREERLAK